MDKPTEIIVESVRDDDYGNRWVTPQGGGEEIKIGEKRSQLHELFQVGNKVSLGWDNYLNKDYVKDASLVSGETKTKAEEPPQPKTDKFGKGQTEGMCWKEIGELIRTGKITNVFGKENAMSITKEYRAYLLATLKLPFDGAKLPQWNTEEKE